MSVPVPNAWSQQMHARQQYEQQLEFTPRDPAEHGKKCVDGVDAAVGPPKGGHYVLTCVDGASQPRAGGADFSLSAAQGRLPYTCVSARGRTKENR
jgi:hypothetical protein